MTTERTTGSIHVALIQQKNQVIYSKTSQIA
ncbi:hypothetical protein A0O36_01116 [Piscirickettsiaceae bacterium NZ-RLO1]|nr:hypothetical protein A0O36_01116 [Piscirickettsiaceae bacterium NZ-RLO1]